MYFLWMTYVLNYPPTCLLIHKLFRPNDRRRPSYLPGLLVCVTQSKIHRTEIDLTMLIYIKEKTSKKYVLKQRFNTSTSHRLFHLLQFVFLITPLFVFVGGDRSDYRLSCIYLFHLGVLRSLLLRPREVNEY